MNGSDILLKLKEWKEKILFGIILLATLMVSVKAKPFSGSVRDINTETRQAAIQAAGADTEQARRVLQLLESPAEINPEPPDQAQVLRPFFDERDEYRTVRPSAWSLTQTTYTRLPPIELEMPGMTGLPDFDAPAGPRPLTSHLSGFIPRDPRPVSLGEEEGPAFD
jgi:hypothetical protein